MNPTLIFEEIGSTCLFEKECIWRNDSPLFHSSGVPINALKQDIFINANKDAGTTYQAPLRAAIEERHAIESTFRWHSL